MAYIAKHDQAHQNPANKLLANLRLFRYRSHEQFDTDTTLSAHHQDATLQSITQHICNHADTDAIYLYGSRSKGTARNDSDWDIAVLFSYFEPDLLERTVRPQLLEAKLEALLPEADIHIVDLREAPVPLQWNIIQGTKLFDRGTPSVRRMENAIISAWEKDYER